MNTYADQTPDRAEVSGRRHRGLRLTSATETPCDRLQAILDQAGLREVRVCDVNQDRIKLWCPDYAGWILAKQELKSCGLMIERT